MKKNIDILLMNISFQKNVYGAGRKILVNDVYKLLVFNPIVLLIQS